MLFRLPHYGGLGVWWINWIFVGVIGMAKKSYDWGAIKVQFINSSLSTREFAEQNDIPFGTLKRKVSKELWLEERSNIAPMVIQRSVEKIIDNRVDELTKFEKENLKAISKAQNKVIGMLEMCEKPNEIKALSSALVDFQKVYRLALGASTENQATQEVTDFNSWLEKIENGQIGGD
ncbi:Uncharacterised protein [Rodentibacter pneumotropicus]|uniref:Uncharacterized protein n=1 Tax=Rodentibacter pneumotropicus TaxID=758 RepID=A0A448MQ74_9PAST|nr:Uncharacterised protein [Rodentibacter pneumotropicus]